MKTVSPLLLFLLFLTNATSQDRSSIPSLGLHAEEPSRTPGHRTLETNPDSLLVTARSSEFALYAERSPNRSGGFPGTEIQHPIFPISAVCDSGRKAPSTLPYNGYNPKQTNIRWGHTAILGGALALTITGVHIYQMNAWWENDRVPFHFVDDNTYALNVDKVGHFLGGAFCSFLAQKSMEWCGFSTGTSVVAGGVLGALFELYVEFEDGFAKNWGFSPGDAYGDLIGAAWPVGQHYIPYMEHFQPKFSYWPSKGVRDGTSDRIIIDDYDGQTAWMGVHIHGLLPCSWQKYWPSWLGIAVGMSVRGVDGPQEDKVRSILLALDYDMTKIIPGDSWFLETFKKALNFLHFPSPAIRISPGYIAYGLYY